MSADGFDSYSVRHTQFWGDHLPAPLLRVARKGEVVDLGCGDGALLHALSQAGLLGASSYAVDVSEIRVDVATKAATGVVGVVADASAVPLPDGCADGVVCSQLIEHVPDDGAVVREIARLLRPNGWWYIGSVQRASRAWWFYKVDGVRRLDPTHVREYESLDQFRKAIEHPLLTMEEATATPVRYPFSDLVLRATGKASTDAYRRIPAWVRRARIRAPGFSLVEATGFRAD